MERQNDGRWFPPNGSSVRGVIRREAIIVEDDDGILHVFVEGLPRDDYRRFSTRVRVLRLTEQVTALQSEKRHYEDRGDLYAECLRTLLFVKSKKAREKARREALRALDLYGDEDKS